MATRREKLEQMLAADPHDKFLRYALAMELDKEGDNDRSLALLTELIEGEPPHVPAFFMAGQQLTRLGQVEKARDVLRVGIEQARQQQDHHAAGEMSEFLASLGQFGE
jgi:thioredoxin-like negative regulator of GroEL